MRRSTIVFALVVCAACAGAPAAEAPDAQAVSRAEFRLTCEPISRGGPPTALFDEPPQMANGSEVGRLLTEARPIFENTGLRELRTSVRLQIDDEGRVAGACIANGSGNGSFDQFALDVAAQMRFEPARSRGRSVASTVQVPIALRLGTA